MMNLRRLLLALVVATSCLVTPALSEGGGQKKTVHIKEYTKKDGTTVQAHDRKAPEPKAARAETPKKESSAKASSIAVARDDRGRIQRSDTARHASSLPSCSAGSSLVR